MSGGPRLAAAGAANLLGAAFGAAVGLGLGALVGRTTGTEGAGVYYVAVAVFVVVSQLGELGADTGLVRFVAAAGATGRVATVPPLVRAALRPVLIGGVATTAAVALLVTLSPGRWLDLPDPLVVGGAALAVVGSMLAVLLAIPRGFHDPFGYPLLQNVALPFTRLVAMLVVASLGAGAATLLGAWMAAVLPVTIAAAWWARRSLRQHVPAGPTESPDVRGFWRFSATRGVASAVEITLEWADVVLVGMLASVEAAGIYAVVTRCARAGEMVQQAGRITLGPSLSASLARGELSVASALYERATAVMIWLAWPLYLLLGVFADTVLRLFGDGFDDGTTALRILLVAMAVSTAAGAVQTVLLMGGRSRWQLGDKSGALALNVALVLVLVPQMGIEGAAIAWAVTLVVDTAVAGYQVGWLMGVRPGLGRPVLASAVSLGVVGGIAVLGRLVLGDSIAALLASGAVAAVAHLAVGKVLARRIGLRA